MTVTEIMTELKELGTEQTRKTFRNHGAPEDCYGVKIGDLKKFMLKKVKHNHELCLALFATGNSDAQYLAGLGIDPKKMTVAEIKQWLKESSWSAIDEAIVSGVAAESLFALDLAQEWLDSTEMKTQNVGWLTYGKYISLTPDEQLLQTEVTSLLTRVSNDIHTAPNTIRYSMNQFIIYVGTYYPKLTSLSLEVAESIREVEITLATKGCRLPDPKLKIEKVSGKNRLGVKRKRSIC